MTFKNLALGYVATAPSPASSGTSLVLEAGQGARFVQPSTGGEFYVTAFPIGVLPDPSNAEIVLVTARTDDTFTITRAQKDTTAKDIAVGWVIIQGIYAEDIFPVIDDDTMATASDTTLATSESIKAYVDANAGAGGKFLFIIPGAAAAGTDVAGTWFTPGAGAITSISLYADAAGATGSTVIDVNLDSTSVFPTSTKPTLSDTDTSDENIVPDTTAFTEGQKITIDIDSITTTAPTDLYVLIKYSE